MIKITKIQQIYHLFIIVIIFTINNANCDRIKDRMYETINGARPCFRRMNGTHQIGCSSKWGGSTGVVHYCRNQNDLEFILKNGTAGPYIPIIPTKLFTKTNMDQFRKHLNKITGLLVYIIELDKQHDYFTHEQKCPNYYSNLPNTCSNNNDNNNNELPIWNPNGSGLLYENIPFPIFYINNNENLDQLIDCFNKFNNYSYDKQRDRPLCSIQMDSFMYGIKNTPTCRRRSNSIINLNPIKYCDPLGDYNIWSMMNLLNYQKQQKTILLITHIDSTTIFDKTTGAITPITNIVTLLTIAKYLKQLLTNNNDDGVMERNLLFLLFNGETYDYMGSQRFYYDLINGHFMINNDETIELDDIELIIDLNQLGSKDTLTLHYLEMNGIIKEFITILQSYKDNLEINESFGTLPPSSLHTFLKHQRNLPGIVITDHNRAYTNHFYHSIYDNNTNIDYNYQHINDNSIQKYIGNISLMLGNSLYYFITGKKVDVDNRIAIDLQLVDELFHCYLEDANCLVHQAVQKLKLPNQPLSLYVGVERDPNFLTVLIGLTLGWVTGDVVGDGNINCTNKHKNESVKYYNMSASLNDLNTTLCYRIGMNFTSAVSPAFIIDDYDWSSGEYSSWTESTWSDIRIRLFLKPSIAHENMTISIGSIVLIFSFLFVYFVKNRSEILFTQTIPTTTTTLAPTSC